jgi:hypothetical protein
VENIVGVKFSPWIFTDILVVLIIRKYLVSILWCC